jgi:hypothetical protein
MDEPSERIIAKVDNLLKRFTGLKTTVERLANAIIAEIVKSNDVEVRTAPTGV